MKLWEVAKGLEEGKFKYEDRFEIFYPDGEFYYAHVGSHDCLWWLKDNEELQLVHIVSYNQDTWRLMDEKEWK